MNLVGEFEMDNCNVKFLSLNWTSRNKFREVFISPFLNLEKLMFILRGTFVQFVLSCGQVLSNWRGHEIFPVAEPLNCLTSIDLTVPFRASFRDFKELFTCKHEVKKRVTLCATFPRKEEKLFLLRRG